MNPSSKTLEGKWGSNELVWHQELEEAKQRALQSEKTMRWYSDCTANWREKWSKVRKERNKTREDLKLMQLELDTALRSSNIHRREKQELEIRNKLMHRELEQIKELLLRHIGNQEGKIKSKYEDIEKTENLDFSNKDSGIEEYVLRESISKHSEDVSHESSSQTENTFSDASEVSYDFSYVEDFQKHNFMSMQTKLEETLKQLATEKEEKANISKSMGKLQADLSDLKEKYENLKSQKQETTRELLQLKDKHENAIANIKTDLANEIAAREETDERIIELRAQIEELQAENTSEWIKRERSETEKQSLERENRKLKSELKDTLERLEKRIKVQPTADNQLRMLLIELSDRNKEIKELKQAHMKMKKVITDKSVELNHVIRRTEQYECEVKKLRTRIEELKRDLTGAEDELDQNNNETRKLQRTNDELQEQVENLQVQVDHLNARLKLNQTTSFLRNLNEQSDEEIRY